MNPNGQKTSLPFDLNVPLEDIDPNPNPNLNPNSNPDTNANHNPNPNPNPNPDTNANHNLNPNPDTSPNSPTVDSSSDPRETQTVDLPDTENSVKKVYNFPDGPPSLGIEYNENGSVHFVEYRFGSRNSTAAKLLAYDPWSTKKIEYTDEDGKRRRLRRVCWDQNGKMIEPRRLLELNPQWRTAGEDIEVFLEAFEVVRRRGGEVHWLSMRNEADWQRVSRVPLLKDLCLRVLVDNPEEVESLEGLTDTMKDVLVSGWCRKRKLSKRLLVSYLAGSPERVRVMDLSLIEQGDFVEVFSRLNCEQLKVKPVTSIYWICTLSFMFMFVGPMFSGVY